MERKKKVGNYVLGSTIGEGKYSTVRQGTHSLSGEKVAVKVVHKKILVGKESARRNFRREAVLLQKLDHPNVVCMYEVLETFNSYYLVVELADGGSLKQYVDNSNSLNEDEAQHYFRQMTFAIHHLQTMGVIHRDLSLENFLLKKNMDLLLTGFGEGSVCENGSVLDTQCVPTVYSAPEMLCGRRYGSAVDVWSLGVCLHTMLTGKCPDTLENIQGTIKHSTMLIGGNREKHMSKDCQNLLLRLLEPAENLRISIFEIIHHKWITPTFIDPFMRKQSIFKRGQQLVKEDILHIMVSVFNFNEADVLRSIDDNKVNSATATYKLLCRKHLPPEQFLKFVSQQSKTCHCQTKYSTGCVSKVSKKPSAVPTIFKPSVTPRKTSNCFAQLERSIPSTLKACDFCDSGTRIFPVCGLKISSLKETLVQNSLSEKTTTQKLPHIMTHQDHQKESHRQQNNHHAQSRDKCHNIEFVWGISADDNGMRTKERSPVANINDNYKFRKTSQANECLPRVPPNTSQGVRDKLSKDSQELKEICDEADSVCDLLIKNNMNNADHKMNNELKPVSSAGSVDDQTISSPNLLAFRTNRGRSMAILKNVAKRNKQVPFLVSGQMVPEGKLPDTVKPVASSITPCNSYTSLSDESVSNDDSLLPVIRVTITTSRH